MGNPGSDDGVINGADVIKITAIGGVLSVAKDGSDSQFTMEELKAVVETANEYGMSTHPSCVRG